jgi:hypothetical protein
VKTGLELLVKLLVAGVEVLLLKLNPVFVGVGGWVLLLKLNPVFGLAAG